MGRAVLTGDVASGSSLDGKLLRWAAAVERGSEHPLGRAIVRAVESRLGVVPLARDFASVPGMGVRGRVSTGSVASSPLRARSVARCLSAVCDGWQRTRFRSATT